MLSLFFGIRAVLYVLIGHCIGLMRDSHLKKVFYQDKCDSSLCPCGPFHDIIDSTFNRNGGFLCGSQHQTTFFPSFESLIKYVQGLCLCAG